MGDSERIEAELLDQCLDDPSIEIEHLEGELSVHADSIQSITPLLVCAQELNQSLAPDRPSEIFIRYSSTRIENALTAKLKAGNDRRISESTQGRSGWFYRPAFALLGLLVIMLILASSAGVAYAASDALPGDALYGLKQGLEEARLGISLSTEGDLGLLSEFAGERLEETEALLDAGRVDDALQALDAYNELNQRASEIVLSIDASGTIIDSSQFQNQLSQQQTRLDELAQTAPEAAQASLQYASLQTKQARSKLQDSLENQTQIPSAPTATAVTGKSPDEAIPSESALERGGHQRAEEIAKQYDVPLEEVWRIYDDQCESEWGCVREHFKDQEKSEREQSQELAIAARLASQYGVDEEFVRKLYNDQCEEDWKCVRQVLRESVPANGPPHKTPKPKENGP